MILTAITVIENKHPHKIANQNKRPHTNESEVIRSAFQTNWLTFASIYSIIRSYLHRIKTKSGKVSLFKN